MADPATPQAWKRLGQALSTRRPQLNPKFKNRQAFARATGIDYRVVFDIEKGARDTFRPETITALETAYGLQTGSFERFRADPSLTEFPDRVGTGSIAFSDRALGRDDLTVHTTDEPEPSCPPGGYSDGGLGATERMIWEHHKDRPWPDRLHAIHILRGGADPIRRESDGQQNGSRREA